MTIWHGKWRRRRQREEEGKVKGLTVNNCMQAREAYPFCSLRKEGKEIGKKDGGHAMTSLP